MNSVWASLITLEVVLLLWALGSLLKSLVNTWRNQLVRECTSQLSTIEHHLQELELKDQRLMARMDAVRELIEKQTGEVGRIRDYLLGPPRP